MHILLTVLNCFVHNTKRSVLQVSDKTGLSITSIAIANVDIVEDFGFLVDESLTVSHHYLVSHILLFEHSAGLS